MSMRFLKGLTPVKQPIFDFQAAENALLFLNHYPVQPIWGIILE
jgi:hypothetical protein